MKPKYSASSPPSLAPSVHPASSSLSSLSSLFPPRQSKMTTTRSTGDIAVDLTEISAPRITKLSSIDSKNQLIMASNGSLVSAGTAGGKNRTSLPSQRFNSPLIPVDCRPASDSAESEVNEEQRKEKVAELRRKEKELQDTLTRKLEELKKVCMREAVSVLNLVMKVRCAPHYLTTPPPLCRRLQGACLGTTP